MDDLGNLFGDLARAVPDGPPGEPDFVFTRQNLPLPPPRFGTDRVFITKTHHDYNGWCRVDSLLVFVDSQVARELGLFLLACVFHDSERTWLELPAGSDVRWLTYESRLRRDDPPPGLSQEALVFRYYPNETKKHPWLSETDVSSLPLLALSLLDEIPVSEADWQRRDCVLVESSAVGTVRLAELLLNAGCSWNRVREYQLEGDAGFRGVAPMSAELRIFLPGSAGWGAHPNPTLR